MYLLVLLLPLLTNLCAEQQLIDETVPEFETLLGEDDFENAKLVEVDSSAVVNDSAMYDIDTYQGDIETGNRSTSERHSSIKRNAIRGDWRRWQNGRMPITISSAYTEAGRAVITSAIEEIQNRTCVRIVKKTPLDTDYVHIYSGSGCKSWIGKIGGRQTLSLGNGCVQKGIAVHELMHALGFFHEQGEFEQETEQTVDDYGTEYDYDSVMHYSAFAFSWNKKPTIVPRKPNVSIGQRAGLSDTDAFKINTMYNCAAAATTPVPTATTPVTTAPDPVTTNVPEPECRDTRGFCPNVQKPCNDGAKQLCPKTCGVCSTTVLEPECRDTRSSCPTVSKPCNEGAKQLCPKTCDACSTHGCLDTLPHCPNVYKPCSEEAKRVCAKSCGAC